jgi:hypothetical protein
VVVTKYSTANFVLLLTGIGVALADVWLAVMTAAFGADPVHDLSSGTVIAVLFGSLVLLPASLITLKWPRLGANISWSVVALCCVSFWASSVVILFLILAAIEGLIATRIAGRGEKTPLMSVNPK